MIKNQTFLLIIFVLFNSKTINSNMIFIIFSLFLQIIPPRKIKVSDPMGCDQYNDLNESGDKDKKSIIECTTENFDFSVQNSKFSNIHAKFFYDWFKSEDLPDRLIQIKNVHGSISNNIINDCSTDENHLILCEDEADRTLYFISNKITKCYKKDGGKYEILSTSYKNNIIKYNYIECIIETKKTSRAYYIKYGRGCQFIGNTIVNAYQGDGSAMLVNSELGNDHEKFQMKDCIFKNCIGDNNDGKNGGLILVIEKINYDFIIQNTTFEDTQITSATKPDQSYLFRFESSSSTIYPVNFSNCKFIRLQSICQGTGGIGFIYNTEGEKK